MNTFRYALAAGAMSLALGSSAAFADASTDAAMLKLAGSSGCTVCHSVEPAKNADGRTPVGPPWRDVAARYYGVKDAQKQLVQIVMKGSNPYDSHWKGKAAGLAMPPNAVAINEADANRLVGWILSMDVR
ncbi:c-type cytochrome [Methyloversatilis discipulorum]|uniref:c-type cytochrome n=1 Tax=Methyloversatilis discipulorum TaxID=1119528 RepID=UPI00037ABCBE|nr:c-type cytochrome [Methyloversatilis discipulorum]